LHSIPPYREKDDLLLIAEGDEQAFYRFYTHYAGLLRPFLAQFTRSQTDVEDILQETFIRVWLNRDRLSTIENMRAWINRIASNVYLDHVEREIKRRERKASFGEALYQSGLSHSAERTHLLDLHHQIRKAMENLTEQKKRVFRMNRELDMKPAQIAAKLNMPVGTVKNQLSAALAEIRKHLLANGYGPLILLFIPSVWC
jgi:RNA polymerase sigma factor, sigma-70 family